MARLVINPGTPQAWEIQLKPGLNIIGRGASNDFKIEDASVSGSHCQIIVQDGSTSIRDMDSTNGTFVNSARVTESHLESGQPLRLGSVDMIFYTDGPDAVTSVVAPAPSAEAPPPPAPRMRPVLKPVGLKISGASPTSDHLPVAIATDAPPPEDSLDPATPAEITGARYCKFHPKSPARFLCTKCNRTFCDLCVTSRNVGSKVAKTCRSCGVECVPVRFQAPAQKSFYASLAGAFTYPLKGAGIIIIICATIAFAALKFVRGGIIGIGVTISVYGAVFLFMQNIIYATTSDESQEIDFPDFSETFGAAFQLGITFIASFWLWTILTILKLTDVADIPVEALIASRILGLIYFPMALLAVAMKDSPLAANPLIVLPAIMKAPVEYSITVLFLLIVYGINVVGDILSSNAGHDMMFTKDMTTLFAAMGIKAAVGLLGVYLLCVNMRMLGLFYNACKQRLGWFAR